VERGLDGVKTAGLVSGQHDARAGRKELVRHVEGLAVRAKSQVQRCDRVAVWGSQCSSSTWEDDAEELD